MRRRILNRMKPKVVNGKVLSGGMFTNLIDSYITTINNGAIPNIENAWSYVCKNEC